MKKINFLFLSVLLVFLAGCDRDEDQLFDKQKDPTLPVLAIEGVTNFVVDEPFSDMYYSVLQWSAPYFGKGYSAQYVIEVASNESFEGTIIAIAPADQSAELYSLTAARIYEWAMAFATTDPETDEVIPGDIFFRIKATEVSPEGNINTEKAVYSNVAAIYTSYKEVGEPTPVTIHFKPVGFAWDEYAVYTWGNEYEEFGEWPGTPLEASPEGWYTINISEVRPVNIIINNNNGGLQFNFLTDPTHDGCYEVQFDAGNATWEEIECPEITVPTAGVYMIGDEFGGWNWESDGVAELTPVNGYEGHYWCIRYISAGKGFKWNTTRAWGGDFNSLGEDIGFTTADGNAFVAEDGMYMVYVDMENNKISVEPAKVFGMGDCFGNWDMGANPFSVEGQSMTYTATGTGELRIYTTSDIAPIGGDWWRMEFVILDGKIAYRGNGGDQERATVETGQKISLDFNTGIGTAN